MLIEKRCAGIEGNAISEFCDRANDRYAFKATVFTSRSCKGFVGYGDADPSNVSPLVHGAEMRVAETRAVNRALRKAYGIGICSVEEIGSLAEPQPDRDSNKRPPKPVNGNYGGPKVRDRLCQIIRKHQLDAKLVKAYAVEYCGTKTLREATREQVETLACAEALLPGSSFCPRTRGIRRSNHLQSRLLRDFLYDPELLGREKIDEKARPASAGRQQG